MACGVLAALTAAGAVGWNNIDDAHRRGGRKVSEGYLRGKVVLVCRDAAQAARMEDVWTSFKTKPFVLLGCFASAPAGSTFPMYDGGALAGEESEAPLYVVDETGTVVYRGEDERKATESVVSALTDMEAPQDVTAARKYLDFEIENLPGHAYLRLKDFGKKYPKDAKDYVAKAKAVIALPDVKKLADLVAFAKKAKDPRQFGAKEKAKVAKFKKIVADAASSEKYKSLLESKDPRIVQEAKNCLADLKWTAASF